MFFLVAFGIWLSVLAHVFLRTQGFLGWKGRRRIVAGLVVVVLGFVYVPARILVAIGAVEGLARILEIIGAWSIGLAALHWTLLVALELVAAGVFLGTRRRLRDMAPERRHALGMGLCLATAVLSIAGFVSAESTPRITVLEVVVPDAEPRRFVMIADAHLGLISSPAHWGRTLRAARELAPDALLIPGDLIEDHSSRLEPQVAALREAFPDEPIFVTTGNHEFYAGPDPFVTLCERHGFRLLRQEEAPLSPGLSIAGIDDLHFAAAEDAVAAVRTSMQGPVLFLTHRPAAARLLADRPETLALAGHTHGGQTLPLVFLVALGNSGFRAGHYEVGEADLYVTRGTGTWGPPLRLFAPPELVVIEVIPGEVFEVRVRD